MLSFGLLDTSSIFAQEHALDFASFVHLMFAVDCVV